MMRFDDGRVTLYATGLLIAVALTTAVNGATWVARQSSVFQDESDLFGPHVAIDGDVDSTSHTGDGDLNPWWELDLGGDHPIEAMRVYTRTGGWHERDYNLSFQILDSTGGLVYASDLINPWNGQGGNPYEPGEAGVFSFDLTGLPGYGVVGQTFRITKQGFAGSEYLSLGEVEVDPGVFIAGDINIDGAVDAGDIDLLLVAARTGTFDITGRGRRYDLNNSGGVDRADVDVLVRDILRSEYGDANLDRRVNITDLSILATNFGRIGVGWAGGDLDGGGEVTIGDLSALAARFGFVSTAANPTATTIPAPASAMLMLVGGSAMRRTRRRRADG